MQGGAPPCSSKRSRYIIMQIKLFAIPVYTDNALEEEMNRFLRGHRVIEVIHEFISEKGLWCFCVKYVEGADFRKGYAKNNQMDYKDILSNEAFTQFVKLRKARKRIAEEDGIPAFVIFTDKQMADLAQLGPPYSENMEKVEGMGKGKASRYAERFERLLESLEKEDNEHKDT